MEVHVIWISAFTLYIWTIGIIRSQTKQMNGRACVLVFVQRLLRLQNGRVIVLVGQFGLLGHDFLDRHDTITTCSLL